LQKRFTLLILIVCAVSISTAAGNSSFFAAASHEFQAVMTTATVGTSFSTSLSQSQQIINGPFTVLSTTGISLQCEFWTFNFTGGTGQYISGNFTSDSPVDFYLVQSSTYQGWVQQGTCGSTSAALASQLLTTSYAFSATALPSSGTWVLVLVNSSNARNAEGTIVAYLSSGGYTITQPVLATITTVASGNTIPSSTNIPGFPPEALLLGIVAGLFALLILRRRKREYGIG